MSIYFEKIPLPEDKLFIRRDFQVLYMSYPLHYHPEIEITFIRRSYGQRFVGDHIESFSDGDLVMIGSNLPHQWQNDNSFRESAENADLTVIHFREDIFGKSLSQIGEFSHIQQLLLESKRGIKFPGSVVQDFEQVLKQLDEDDITQCFLGFVGLLNVLANSKKKELLSSNTLRLSTNNTNNDRINNVYSFMLANYHSEISLSEVAQSVHLSDSAFSHFIKKKTGLTFSELLNDLRIRYAGKLLQETDLSVTDICYKVGYRNLSYFNRQFKKVKRCSPMAYRKEFQKAYLDDYQDHSEVLLEDNKKSKLIYVF